MPTADKPLIARTYAIATAAFLSLVIVSSAFAADIGDERRAELAYMFEQDCGSCHGLSMKGGLGSPLLPEIMADRDDETLIHIILEGVPGTPMPPWKMLLSRDDAVWMVELIRKGR